MGFIQDFPATQTPPIRNSDEYLCWTRMQAEAGQDLSRIIRRKEAERVAGGGLFFWGVGNAPATLIPTLSRCDVRVPVVFSVMKSAPKPADAQPSAVVVWNAYIDARGVERPLPAHALVLSRRDSPSGPKRTHYALMCYSEEPLIIRSGEAFDHRAFRNASDKGAPVGASQVTALLRPIAGFGSAADYEANMRAVLTGSYWVRLTRPTEVPISVEIPEPDPDHWMKTVAGLRPDTLDLNRQADGQLL